MDRNSFLKSNRFNRVKQTTLSKATQQLITNIIANKYSKSNMTKTNKRNYDYTPTPSSKKRSIQINNNPNNNSLTSIISPTSFNNYINNNNNNNNNNKPTATYIKYLIKNYYNNDTISNKYLSGIHKKLHAFPLQSRMIVIGDIHGDLDAIINCLILAKCILPITVPKQKTVNTMDDFFNNLKWIGGNTYVIQLGDQIDRIRAQRWDQNNIPTNEAFEDEGSTLEILYLFSYLDQLAQIDRGRVLSIIGNHEIMNVEGDFSYVSLKEFECFKKHLGNIYVNNSRFPYHSKTLKKHGYKVGNSYKHMLPIGYKERLYSFAPTGICSNFIGYNNYTVLQVGHWLFCVCYNLMVEPNKTTFIATILILIFSLYNYYKYNT